MRRIFHQSLLDFSKAIFRAAGSSREEAEIVAAHLVEANLLGHDSHGVIRISKYVEWARDGRVAINRHAVLAVDNNALVVVDGQFGYGQVIGKEAMQIAEERAKVHGMAAVAIRNSGHLGRVGAWPEQLAERGLTSIHFVNTSGFGILVAPFGGSDRRLSANPIAAGVPNKGGHPIILDMATSSIAEGKIQIARNMGEKLPPNAVVDGRGRPTLDPNAFYAEPPGAILPFGGHKGSGLSFFCEILAGSLSGGLASNPRSPTAGQLVNNMLSIAFDPEGFVGAEAFAADVKRLVDWAKGSPPMTHGGKVRLPGDLEDEVRAERMSAGIPVDDATWKAITNTAASLAVAIPTG